MNPVELLMKIPGLGGMINSAPQAISGFLNELLKENRPLLDKAAGEVKMFFIMFPISDKEYQIAIVTSDKEDKILRTLKTMKLSEALAVIFNTDNHE